MDDCDWFLSVEKACDWLRIEPGVTVNFFLGHPVCDLFFWRNPVFTAPYCDADVLIYYKKSNYSTEKKLFICLHIFKDDFYMPN